MKRNLSVILVFILLLSAITGFASCKSDKNESEKKEQQQTQSQETDKKEETEKTESVEEKEEEKKQVEIPSDFKDAYDKKIAAAEEIKSMKTVMTGVADVVYMEEAAQINAYSEVSVSFEDMLAHIVAQAEGEPMIEAVNTELYADIGETPFVYTLINGEWIKSEMTDEDNAEMRAFLGEADTTSFDIYEYMSNTELEEETYNDIACYKLSYDVSVELYNIIKDLGYENEFKQALTDNGVPSESMFLLKSMLNKLGTVSVVEYVDASTMYPVATEIDATDSLQNILDKVYTFAPMVMDDENDEELEEIEIDNFTLQIEYSGINDTKVEIPENVLSANLAENVAIIGGADGPTEIVVTTH